MDSAFVNIIAGFCSFKLIFCAGVAGEPSLIIKDEGCPNDALLLHLPLGSLISFTWAPFNLLFALCTGWFQVRQVLCRMCQVSFLVP